MASIRIAYTDRFGKGQGGFISEKIQIRQAHEAIEGWKKADSIEWERLIEDNPIVRSEIEALKDKYNLPLSSDSHRRSWFNEANNKRQKSLKHDLKVLSEKHDLHYDRWGYSLLTYVLFNEPHFGSTGILRDEFGRIIIDIKTPQTRPDDPGFQLALRVALGSTYFVDIPSPQPIEGHPKGKKDWRPVLEWFHRHSEISKAERYRMIAEALEGIESPKYVENKLREIDCK